MENVLVALGLLGIMLLLLLVSSIRDKKAKGFTAASIKTQTESAENSYVGEVILPGIAGAFVGGLIGFILRPAVPLIGQVPFNGVISRGSNYRGLDQLLVSYAQESFNYMVLGLIVGSVGGAWAGYYFLSKKKAEVARAKSVELDQSPEQVEVSLGQPEKKVNLGSKVVYVYKDMKVIFIDGKVSDVQ